MQLQSVKVNVETSVSTGSRHAALTSWISMSSLHSLQFGEKMTTLTDAIRFVDDHVGLVVAGGIGLTVLHRWIKDYNRKRKTIKSTRDKCVVITGCDSGLGKLLVEKARAAGFFVVAACYTQEGADLYTRSVHQVKAVVGDLTTADGRKKVVETCELACAGFDLSLYALINNAGVVIPGHIEWLDPSVYEKTMKINFHAPVSLIYELLPLLKRNKGRVVNVSSVDGFISLPVGAPYCASKHALESFSDCLRCELLPFGVKVIIVQPSTLNTPMLAKFVAAYRKNYEDAPQERKAPYGDEWMDTQLTDTEANLFSAAMNPNETVDEVMNSLLQVNPPTRIVSGILGKLLFKPLSWLPDHTRDRILFNSVFANSPNQWQCFKTPRPPLDKISHVTIAVTSLEPAVEFYMKLGLEIVGKPMDKQQFMVGGGRPEWKVLVLLKEEPSMSTPRGTSPTVGMTRLSIYTTDLKQTVEKLRQRGLTPAFEVAVDKRQGAVAAYKDPDGFMVHLIQMYSFSGVVSLVSKWAHRIKDPWICHWTISVHKAKRCNLILERIGFTTIMRSEKHQISKDLIPAFGVKEQDASIESNYIMGRPLDQMLVAIMEWREPKGRELTNTLSISVANAKSSLGKALKAGMIVPDMTLQTRQLPYFGTVKVGTAYLEQDCNRVEFVEF